ncbi:unnamed protein product [Symbiodinium sp. CCMP2592]|nr:unnamed protein product [Symbiodinium sp. CCMP2592]
MSGQTEQERLARQLALASRQYSEQAELTAQPVYSATQTLFFEERRANKRGPPTPSMSSMGTPGGPMGVGGAQTTPTTPQGRQSLFQPIPLDQEASIQATAFAAGVEANDPANVKRWLGEAITTRQQVLETVRHYHTAVLRPELYNMITQVEHALVAFDDRLLRQSKELSWMVSENRTTQRQQAALVVILTGWSNTMPPEDRLYMVTWLLQQVTAVRHFLQTRGYKLDDDSADKVWLNCLTTDPSTPPAGEGKWSNITLIHFKSWDLRRAFMEQHGGSSGVPLYQDGSTPIRGHHIRATPSSPQFQRKLEIPIRVILQALNVQSGQPSQVVILWKTLTIMAPQEVRAFDPQIKAMARLHYYSSDDKLQGTLEITTDLFEILNATPPAELMTDEPSIWTYCWNKVVFGPQHELDVAERDLFKHAAGAAKGSSKGISVGKGGRHWTAPLIYSAQLNPFPIDLYISKVSDVAFVWDEYCDKFKETSSKVGSYKQATYQGAPAVATPHEGASFNSDGRGIRVRRERRRRYRQWRKLLKETILPTEAWMVEKAAALRRDSSDSSSDVFSVSSKEPLQIDVEGPAPLFACTGPWDVGIPSAPRTHQACGIKLGTAAFTSNAPPQPLCRRSACVALRNGA